VNVFTLGNASATFWSRNDVICKKYMGVGLSRDVLVTEGLEVTERLGSSGDGAS
jgi:hypothetical protein